PVGIANHWEAAEIVERDLRRRIVGQQRGAVVVNVAQDAVAETVARNGAQLLLDPLQRLSDRGTAGQCVVEVKRPGIEVHRIKRGEPADRAGEIDVRIEWLTAVSLEIDEERQAV